MFVFIVPFLKKIQIFNTEQKTMMMEFIGNIGSAFPQVYQEWISSLTPDIKEEWSKISF